MPAATTVTPPSAWAWRNCSSRRRADLAGRVKFVFQPAEEGCGGALAMVADGVLDNPTPSAAFGMHLWSRLPLNQVIVQSGPLWANAASLS